MLNNPPIIKPIAIANTTFLPSKTPKKIASFTSPIPIPSGYTKETNKNNNPTPHENINYSFQLFRNNKFWIINPIIIDGIIILLGIIWCLISIKDIKIRIVPKKIVGISFNGWFL